VFRDVNECGIYRYFWRKNDPGGRSGPGGGGPVQSMGRHETDRHGLFSGEGSSDPPLDQTVVGHGTVHGPI
jgi:hypothetical protein